MSRFKQAVMWWVIIALLIVVVRVVIAQASEAMQTSGKCVPAVVYWRITKGADTLNVESYTCVDFRKDSLILIPHIAGGEGKGMMVVQKRQVKRIILLQPVQQADLRPRA